VELKYDAVDICLTGLNK